LFSDFSSYRFNDILTNEDVVEAYFLGKKNGINNWISICAAAMSRLDGPLNLEQLQLEDWVHILSGPNGLSKKLWANLTDWIKIFPHHKDEIPMMLAKVEGVSWYQLGDEFSNAEREKLFMIGKEMGTKV
jgi:hypothetical protein